MQITSPPRWFRMVSSATAVLPVWRSPMISSRWPRPMGIMESMALIPVCSGSRTGWRSTTPGAMRSMGLILIGEDGTLAVGGAAQRIHHAAHQGLAHRHRHDAIGALDDVAFLDLGVVAQQHRAHLVFFQVQRQARHVVRQREQFARHDAVKAVNAGHAVSHGNDRAHFGHRHAAVEVLDLFANNLGDFVGFNLWHLLASPKKSRVESRKSRVKSAAISCDLTLGFLSGCDQPHLGSETRQHSRYFTNLIQHYFRGVQRQVS